MFLFFLGGGAALAFTARGNVYESEGVVEGLVMAVDKVSIHHSDCRNLSICFN